MPNAKERKGLIDPDLHFILRHMPHPEPDSYIVKDCRVQEIRPLEDHSHASPGVKRTHFSAYMASSGIYSAFTRAQKASYYLQKRALPCTVCTDYSNVLTGKYLKVRDIQGYPGSPLQLHILKLNNSLPSLHIIASLD